MKYAILSDIHGNLEAYQAVLDDLKKEKDIKYFCVGDIVGYGADPNACIEITRRLNPTIVCGNHDWAAAGSISVTHFNLYAKKAALWTASVLDDRDKDYLKSLKLTYMDNDITLVHGALTHPECFEYIFDLHTAYRTMELTKTKVVFIGHTHFPAIYTLKGENIEYIAGSGTTISEEKKYLVNVGSIGQPRDGDWRASFCIWDRDEETIEIRRLEYDVEKAQKKILDAGLPKPLAYRLGEGR